MSNKNLKQKYMNLSRADKYHIKVRNEIIAKCKINTAIFYNWVKGITPVPELAKPIIAEIFKMQVAELFPEPEQIEIL